MKVLIVEDHPLFAGSLVQYCSNNKWQVSWAKNYAEFCENLSAQHYDLAFVDLMLTNGYDGFDVCRELKKNSRNTIVIIISSFDNDALIKKANKLNVDGYLVKTAQFEEIDLAIDEIKKGKKYRSQDLTQRANQKEAFLQRNSITIPGINREKLSPRELEVMLEMVHGNHADDALASKFGIAVYTVRDHKQNIYKKLGVHDVASAIKYYYHQKL